MAARGGYALSNTDILLAVCSVRRGGSDPKEAVVCDDLAGLQLDNSVRANCQRTGSGLQWWSSRSAGSGWSV